MVDMGISSSIMKSPSPKCYMTFWDMAIYNDNLKQQQQVCSKSTSKVFLRMPYLVPALALSFFMLHVAI